MKIFKIAQNIPYLVNTLGVPVENAQAILDYIETIDKKDKSKVIKRVKDNPNISLDELKAFKIYTQEDKQKLQEEKLSRIPEDARKWAMSINPSYIDWLYKQIVNESVATNGEDDELVKETLKNFDILKRRKDFPKENKDINFYKTFPDLAELVSNLTPEKSETVISANDPDIIYDEDGVRIMKIDATSDEKIKKINEITANTKCCIRYESSVRSYASSGISYHFAFINEDLVASIHIGSQQIKNEFNGPLSNNSQIKTLHEVFQKIGLEKQFPKDGDFSYYFKMLKIGEEINNRVNASQDKKEEIEKLQKEFIAKDRTSYVSDRDKFGENARNQHVVYFLSDEQFENPQIQDYIKDVFGTKLDNSRNTTDQFAKDNYSLYYESMPLQLKLIPEIRERNKNYFVEKMKTTPWTKEFYRSMGRELKSYPEIQSAYKEMIERKMETEPNFFLSSDFPERFKKIMQKDYAKYLVNYMEKSPEFANSFIFSGHIRGKPEITNRYYETIPENIKQLPEIQKAFKTGLLNNIQQQPDNLPYLPENYKNDPEFIAAAKQGLLQFTKRYPERYNDLPQSLKDDEEFKQAYKEGIIRKVKIDPLHYNKVPEEFKNLPELQVALKEGWIENLTDMRDERAYELYNTANAIPDQIKQLPEFKEIFKTKIVPHVVKELKYNLVKYDKLSGELKENSIIKQTCENVTIESLKKNPKNWDVLPESIRTLPKVQMAWNKAFIPSFLKQIERDYAAYTTMPNALQEQQIFKDAYIKGWIFTIQNPKDIAHFQFLMHWAPKEVLEHPEVQKIIKEKTTQMPIQGWINTVVHNPFTLKNVPKDVQSNPEFQKGFLEGFIYFLNYKNPNPKAIEIFMMQNKSPVFSDPRVKQALIDMKTKKIHPQQPTPQITKPTQIANQENFNARQRQPIPAPVASNWYNLIKESSINPIKFEIEQIKEELNQLDKEYL